MKHRSVKKDRGTGVGRSPLLEPLEPRLLLAADLAAGLLDPAGLESRNSNLAAEIHALLPPSGTDGGGGLRFGAAVGEQRELPLPFDLQALGQLRANVGAPPGPADAASNMTRTDTDASRREVVIVDAGVDDYQQLLADLLLSGEGSGQVEVHVLDRRRDGIEQVSEVLGGYRDLDAVHFVSHGTGGAVQLGDASLNMGALQTNREAIRDWSAALGTDADLLFYGCDLAGSAEGKDFVAALGELTGADVAASDDRTGSSRLGADWDLEHTFGEVESRSPFSRSLQIQWGTVLGAGDPLWLSTQADVNAGGQPGNDTWQDGDLVRIANPNLAFGPGTTNGTFSVAFDIDLYAPGAKVNASHYVTSDIRVGTSNFQLVSGDLILSTKGTSTFTSASAPSAPGFTNSLTVEDFDVLVFRPDSPGDYSAGTFAMLLEDASGSGADIKGISLIEKDTTVGDANLQAGDFLFLRGTGGSGEDRAIWLFETDDVGAGNTNGTRSVLLDTSDPGISIDRKLEGIDLVEVGFSVGGRTLATGNLLVTVDESDDVGSNNLSVTQFDLFSLDVSQTTMVAGSGNGSATASLFFQGGGVGFETNPQEDIDALTLTVVPNSGELLLTTTGPGAVSQPLSWTSDEVIQFGDPGYSLEPGITSGTLASLFDLGNFVAGANVDAVHFVTSNLTVGSGLNTFDLEAGDLLLSTTGTHVLPGGVTVNMEDVFVFHPTSADYSTGTFSLLLDDPASSLGVGVNDLSGISLVERTTTVGDATVQAGTFLLSSHVGASEKWNIYNFAPTAVGEGTTVGPNTILIDGDVVGLGPGSSRVSGIELVEEEIVLGGQVLSAGQILVTLDKAKNSVGDNSISVAAQDVFYLDVKTTGEGTTSADAFLLFEGADAEFAAADEDINGIALFLTNKDPDPPFQVTNAGSSVSEGGTDPISATELRFEDLQQPAPLVIYTVTDSPDNGQLELTTAPTVAVVSFTQEDIDAGRLVYVHDGSETTSDSFSFDVDDSRGNTVTGNTFSITVNPVNDEPSGTDNTVSTDEDTDHTFATADFGFSDPAEGDALLAVKITTLPAAGTLRLSGVAVTAGQSVSAADIAAGNLVYTPPPNANGAGLTSFTFQVQDDGTTANGGIDLDQSPNTLTIDVDALNDPPRNLGGLPGDLTATAAKATNLDLSAIEIGDVDAGAGALTLTLRTSAGGTLLATNAGGVSVAGSGGGTLTLTGTVAALNAFLDNPVSIQFQSTAGASGNNADSVILEVRDNGNTGIGPAVTVALGKVNVDVEAVVIPNQPPPPNVDPDPDDPPVDPEPPPTVAEADSPPLGGPPSVEPDVPPVGSVDPLPSPGGVEREPEPVPTSERDPGPRTTIDRTLDAVANLFAQTLPHLPAQVLDSILESRGIADLRALVGRSDFIGALDRMQDEVVEFRSVPITMVGSTVAATTALSVGYVVWIARGGMLLASMLSSMPAWRLVDPFPILARLEEHDEANDESLHSMIKAHERQQRADAVAPGAGSTGDSGSAA